MKIAATAPLIASPVGRVRQSSGRPRGNSSGRIPIVRPGHLIGTIDGDGRHLARKWTDKWTSGIFLAGMILSVIYFRFRPGAHLMEMFFLSYGSRIGCLL